MFASDLMILTKYLAVSGVLLLVFVWLLRGRVTYPLQRIALLSILPLSFAVAVTSFDIIGVEQESLLGEVIVEISEIESVVTEESFEIEEYADMGERDDEEDIATSPFDGVNWWIVAWGSVAMVLLIRFLLSVGYILRLRRFADIEQCRGYSVCRCGLVDSPFSFLRSIYIDRALCGEKLDIVLQHEVAHIRHYHYLDKIIVEILAILMWFNPIVWILRKELCVVHEFEADRTVLKGFLDVRKYKQFLFDEVSKPSPRVANGFNNSLIKQRFLEMKNRGYGKSYFVRKLLYLSFVVMVVSIISLIYIIDDQTDDVDMSQDSVSLYVRFKNGTSTTRTGGGMSSETSYYTAEIIESVNLSISDKSSGYIKHPDSIEMVLSYVKSGDFEALPPFAMHERSVISSQKKRTLLYDDGHIEEYWGEDIKSAANVDYRLLTSSTQDDGEGGATRIKYGGSKAYVVFEKLKDGEVVFSKIMRRGDSNPLGDKILVTFKDESVKGYDSENLDEVLRIPTSKIKSINIRKAPKSDILHESDFDPNEKITYTPSTTGTPIDDRTPAEKRVKFYDLRRDQITVINPDDFKYGKMVAYRRKDCTEVDFVFPIFYSKQWFSHSSETFMIDPKSGKWYQIQEVANRVPIDRYVRVIGQVGRTVLFTCKFPPLPKGVNRINMLEYPIRGQIMPSHSGGDGPWMVKDILVLDDVEREYCDVDSELLSKAGMH